MENGMSQRRRRTQRDLFAEVGLPERFPPEVGRTLLMLLEALLREAASEAPVDGESGDDQNRA
jgi:hypothetical protein